MCVSILVHYYELACSLIDCSINNSLYMFHCSFMTQKFCSFEKMYIMKSLDKESCLLLYQDAYFPLCPVVFHVLHFRTKALPPCGPKMFWLKQSKGSDEFGRKRGLCLAPTRPQMERISTKTLLRFLAFIFLKSRKLGRAAILKISPFLLKYF